MYHTHTEHRYKNPRYSYYNTYIYICTSIWFSHNIRISPSKESAVYHSFVYRRLPTTWSNKNLLYKAILQHRKKARLNNTRASWNFMRCAQKRGVCARAAARLIRKTRSKSMPCMNHTSLCVLGVFSENSLSEFFFSYFFAVLYLRLQLLLHRWPRL